jgi:hypothetical protein
VSTVVAYVPDVMDRSKLVAVRADVVFVADPRALVDAPGDVVVVDLMRDGVLEVLPALRGRRVIGFGRHTERARLEAAAAAGCDEVLPRSAFFPRVAALLAPG